MRRLAEILSLLVAIGIQISLWPQLTTAILPAFTLVIALVWGYADNPVAGFRTAFIGGLLLDLYHQQIFGMLTIALMVAYASTLLLRTPSDETAPLSVRISATVLAAVVYELVVLGWIALTTTRLPFFELLAQVATLNAVGTVIAFILFQPLLPLMKPTYYAHHARSL